MHGIVYRLHYYVATLLKILKENLSVFSRIGDTNKLSAFSPCKPLTLVGGSLSSVAEITERVNTGLAYTAYNHLPKRVRSSIASGPHALTLTSVVKYPNTLVILKDVGELYSYSGVPYPTYFNEDR